MSKLHILWPKNIDKKTFKNYNESNLTQLPQRNLHWVQGSDSYDVIIPRNIVAILGTSTALNSELVKVTGAQKKEYNTILYKGKEEVEKMKSHSDLTFLDAKKE